MVRYNVPLGIELKYCGDRHKTTRDRQYCHLSTSTELRTEELGAVPVPTEAEYSRGTNSSAESVVF